MKEIIAQSKLYKLGKTWSSYNIIVYMPERDPILGGDFRCGVKISSNKIKYTHGVDTFQALNLAFVLIHIEAKKLIKEKCKLYLCKDKSCEFDIKTLILHDFSKYLKISIKYRNLSNQSLKGRM